VLPGFFSIPWLTDQLLQHINNPAINTFGVLPDVFAVGAYFGGGVADEIILNGEADTITVNEILNRAREELTVDRPDPFAPGETNPSFVSVLRENKAVTDMYGIPLVAYEGGQHLVESRGWDNNPTLADKNLAANRHSRMYNLYGEWCNLWGDNGGGLLLHYSMIRNNPIKLFGAFGSLEYTEQPLTDAPKHQALLDLINPDL